MVTIQQQSKKDEEAIMYTFSKKDLEAVKEKPIKLYFKCL